MADQVSLNLESSLESLSEIEREVAAFGAEHGWPADLLFHVQLVLDELATNVINHGYGASGHEFQITIKSKPQAVRIEMVDEARPFDPLQDAPNPTTDASLEEREAGGLGVHIAKQLMDEMEYRREDGKNRLTLVKNR